MSTDRHLLMVPGLEERISVLPLYITITPYNPYGFFSNIRGTSGAPYNKDYIAFWNLYWGPLFWDTAYESL